MALLTPIITNFYKYWILRARAFQNHIDCDFFTLAMKWNWKWNFAFAILVGDGSPIKSEWPQHTTLPGRTFTRAGNEPSRSFCSAEVRSIEFSTYWAKYYSVLKYILIYKSACRPQLEPSSGIVQLRKGSLTALQNIQSTLSSKNISLF